MLFGLRTARDAAERQADRWRGARQGRPNWNRNVPALLGIRSGVWFDFLVIGRRSGSGVSPVNSVVQTADDTDSTDENLKASVECNLTIRHMGSGIKQEAAEAAEFKFFSALSAASCSMVLAVADRGAVESQDHR